MCAVRWTITTTVDVRIDNLLINTTYTQIKHKSGQLSKKGCDSMAKSPRNGHQNTQSAITPSPNDQNTTKPAL